MFVLEIILYLGVLLFSLVGFLLPFLLIGIGIVGFLYAVGAYDNSEQENFKY